MRRGRLAKLVAVVLATAAVLVPAGSAGLRNTANPTLYFMYTMNCTFSIVNDAGAPVSSIVPGNYQIYVETPVVFGMYPMTLGQSDYYACRGVPMFQLTGPGVNIFTTMTAGCEQEKLFTATLQPNSTYVATDQNQPALTKQTFTTLATGAPAPVAVTYGNGKSYAQSSEDIAGSLKIKAILDATLGTDGSLSLLNSGKNVTSLAAGRYKFAIKDLDPKASFIILGPSDTSPKALTPSGFKGTKSVTLSLTPGKWSYYTTLAAVHSFRVT